MIRPKGTNLKEQQPNQPKGTKNNKELLNMTNPTNLKEPRNQPAFLKQKLQTH